MGLLCKFGRHRWEQFDVRVIDPKKPEPHFDIHRECQRCLKVQIYSLGRWMDAPEPTIRTP
jgi:hypothetical protein